MGSIKSVVMYIKDGKFMVKKINLFNKNKILSEIFADFNEFGNWSLKKEIEFVCFENFVFDIRRSVRFSCLDYQNLTFDNCRFDTHFLEFKGGDIQLKRCIFKRNFNIRVDSLENFNFDLDMELSEISHIKIENTDNVFLTNINGCGVVSVEDCRSVRCRNFKNLKEVKIEAEVIDFSSNKELVLDGYFGISLDSEKLILNNSVIRSNKILINCEEFCGKDFLLVSDKIIKINNVKYFSVDGEETLVLIDEDFNKESIRMARERLISSLKGLKNYLVKNIDNEGNNIKDLVVNNLENRNVLYHYKRVRRK